MVQGVYYAEVSRFLGILGTSHFWRVGKIICDTRLKGPNTIVCIPCLLKRRSGTPSELIIRERSRPKARDT